jgi:uncharacterized RDD family membrane protein YckC
VTGPDGGAAAASPGVEYVGFWVRLGASILDSIAVIVLVAVLSFLFWDGWSGPKDDLANFTVNWVLPAIAVLIFWFARGATPGKMVVSAVIVDAHTLGAPTPRQFAIRYLGYYVSTIPLFLGLLWIAFDARKQGWHDKMANTVVIRRRT